MIIARFESLEEAQLKLDDYNDLARAPSSPPEFNLTDIMPHLTLPLWWFNASDCINNGGLNKVAIAEDVATLDTVEIATMDDLRTEGYLPLPDDE